jgi:hypothetical protein
MLTERHYKTAIEVHHHIRDTDTNPTDDPGTQTKITMIVMGDEKATALDRLPAAIDIETAIGRDIDPLLDIVMVRGEAIHPDETTQMII